jgi:DNA modification methylase
MDTTTEQLYLFDIEIDKKIATSTTFIDNMKLPVHRWFRFSAGFSAEWVKSVINEYANKDTKILDPFAGSGTTLVAADEMNIPSIGYEKQYYIRRIAEIKLQYSIDFGYLDTLYNEIIQKKTSEEFNFDKQPELLQKCYTKESLEILISLRNNFWELADNTKESEIVWLALTSVLRSSSNVGTAQWQYILPNKKKKNVAEPKYLLSQKINEITNDIKIFNKRGVPSLGSVLNHDAREVAHNYTDTFDLLITSPPYPNNYDYADATRLEMVFWGEITGWSDLQSKVRKELIHSCSQHSAAEKLKLGTFLDDKLISPIQEELTEVCEKLERIRFDHGGKKTYHTMIAAYYYDLAKVFVSLRQVMREGATICFVIGDSAPYGVYAPADIWLGKLAISAGFKSWTFEKTRDRNIKWKNRKHSVPLKEGRLWIRG